MNTLKKILAACTIGVVLVLIIIFAERHFLSQAEERGRKSGLAIQAAQDQKATDYAVAVVQMRAQAVLDSVERADSVKFARVDTVYRKARAQLVTDTLFQHDPVAQQVVAAADTDIRACTETALSCAVARANAERDAARLRITVADRDTTILRFAHQTVPPPRSCVPQTLAGGLVGAAAAIVFTLHR